MSYVSPKIKRQLFGLLFGHLGKFSSQSWQSLSLPQAIRTRFTALPWARSFTFVGGGAIHLQWFWSCQAVPGGQTNGRDMTIWDESYIIDEVLKGIKRYNALQYDLFLWLYKVVPTHHLTCTGSTKDQIWPLTLLSFSQLKPICRHSTNWVLVVLLCSFDGSESWRQLHQICKQLSQWPPWRCPKAKHRSKFLPADEQRTAS